MASLILEVGNYLTVMAEACVSGVGLGGVSITIQNYFNMSLVRGPLFLIFSVDVYVLICFISLHVVTSEAGLLLKFNWERHFNKKAGHLLSLGTFVSMTN